MGGLVRGWRAGGGRPRGQQGGRGGVTHPSCGTTHRWSLPKIFIFSFKLVNSPAICSSLHRAEGESGYPRNCGPFQGIPHRGPFLVICSGTSPKSICSGAGPKSICSGVGLSLDSKLRVGGLAIGGGTSHSPASSGLTCWGPPQLGGPAAGLAPGRATPAGGPVLHQTKITIKIH